MKFSELTTTKLSSDNSLLKEELEMIRGQLIDAKKALASQETQLQVLKMESELKEESEIKSSTQKKKVWRENLVSYPDPPSTLRMGSGNETRQSHFHTDLLNIMHNMYNTSLNCIIW